MKANEIRIDNLLFYDTGESVETNFVDWEDIKMCYVDNEYFNEHYSAIPLTEDWLLKFGFKQNLDKWFEINYFTDCTLSAEKMGILINLCSNRCAILDTDTDQQSAMTAKRIYYVHQLQNLYHALTGEELTLTES